MSKRYPNLSLLHVDAHPDLYDEFQGNRYSHASPFARIMEENLVVKVSQSQSLGWPSPQLFSHYSIFSRWGGLFFPMRTRLAVTT